MILRPLEVSNLEYPIDICLLTYSAQSQELCENLGFVKRVKYIIDANAGKHGQVICHNHTISIVGYDILDTIDVSEFNFIITDDYYKEVFDTLCNMSVFKEFSGTIYYYLNEEGRIEESYRLQYENTPLENIIVFRSGPHMKEYVQGLDFSDNARILFEYMLSNQYNKKYKLIWIVKNPEEYTEKYSAVSNVEFLPAHWAISEDLEQRDAYYKVLSLAKFFFFTDAYGIGKYCRPGQVRVQLWHGCGFKSRFSNTSCQNRYEYMTVTGPLYAREHARVFGLRQNQILNTGIPKGDLVVDSGIEQETLCSMLQIPKAQHYILWLPTYRKAKAELKQTNGYDLHSTYALPLIENGEQLSQVNEYLKKTQTFLLVKLHPFQEDISVNELTFSNIIFLNNGKLLAQGLSINHIMGMTDALLSDYSSAAVDYLALDRPIGFCIEDIENYKADRGFIFEDIESYLPGVLLDSYDTLYGFLQDVLQNKDTELQKRKALRLEMNAFSDGKNCERILDVLGI